MGADGGRELDLAIIGGGVAGTRVAHAMQQARPHWSIALFERTDRIGGRLRSVRVDGRDHPIELGGMRYLTDQQRVSAIVEGFQLPTHPFYTIGAPERRTSTTTGSPSDGRPAGTWTGLSSTGRSARRSRPS